MIRFYVALMSITALTIVGKQLHANESHVAHMVFFTLAEDSPEHRKELVDACDTYLNDHDGTVYYSAGTIADDLKRDVNDRDFHVALHIVFASKADHDRYQTHARHLKFIDENKQLWSGVRVFDSYANIASPSPLELVLAQQVSFAFDRLSLEQAVRQLQRKVESTKSFKIELDTQSLKFEGVTKNMPIQRMSVDGKSLADALTEIVVRANPIRGVAPNHPQQKLIWVADGMTIRVTTRRGAGKHNLVPPAVFMPDPK